MGKDYGMVKVVAKLDYDDEDDLAGITVPIPDWLTNDFEPSKPVTAEQTKRFLTRGIEPYEGYAAEFQKWEDGWNDVRRRQAEADGEPYYMSEPVEVDPEFDEEGRPIAYDEVNIVQDPDSGAASMDLPEDQYTDEDWEQEEKEEQDGNA